MINKYLHDGMFAAKALREQEDAEAFLHALLTPQQADARAVQLKAELELAHVQEREARHAHAKRILNDPYQTGHSRSMAQNWLEY